MINPKYEQMLLLVWTFGLLMIEHISAEDISSFHELIASILAYIIAGIIYYTIGLVILVFANGIYTILNSVGIKDSRKRVDTKK